MMYLGNQTLPIQSTLPVDEPMPRQPRVPPLTYKKVCAELEVRVRLSRLSERDHTALHIAASEVARSDITAAAREILYGLILSSARGTPRG